MKTKTALLGLAILLASVVAAAAGDYNDLSVWTHQSRVGHSQRNVPEKGPF